MAEAFLRQIGMACESMVLCACNPPPPQNNPITPVKGKHFRDCSSGTATVPGSEASVRTLGSMSSDGYGASLRRGVQRHDEGRFAEAAVFLKQAVEETPDDAECWYMLGNSLHESGEKASAMLAYQEAVNIDPCHALSYYNMGYMHQDDGDMEEAVECFEASCRLDPSDPAALINLGNVLRSIGRTSEATAHYRAAVQLEDTDVMALYNLATVLQNAGGEENQSEAISLFKQAIDLDPGCTDAYFNLGVAYLARDELDRALRCYQTCTKLDPTFTEAAEAITYISQRQEQQQQQQQQQQEEEEEEEG